MRPFLLTAILAAACGDRHPVEPANAPVLPPRLHLVGEASGEDASGRTASCQLDLMIELKGPPRRVGTTFEYEGTHGGDVNRTVLAPDGSGLSFWADVYWPSTVVRLLPGNRVELVLGDTVRVKTESGRFWQEIALLRGMMQGTGSGAGAWTCAPFDIDQGGYVDTSLAVAGSWRVGAMTR